MSSSRNVALVAGSILAIFATSSIAGAQQQLSAVQVSAATQAEATALHAKGVTISGSLSELRKASRLHEQSALLRGSEDPKSFECMHEAALLRYYSGDRRGGADLMERAGHIAAARGDVVAAARSFSDAAIIAYESKQSARAWELGVRADALTASPLLSEAQRTDLRATLVQLDRGNQRLTFGGK